MAPLDYHPKSGPAVAYRPTLQLAHEQSAANYSSNTTVSTRAATAWKHSSPK